MRAARTVWFVLTLLLTYTPATADSVSSDPKAVVQAYISNLIRQDWPSAQEKWHPDDLRRSQRLGIVYMGAPLKIDCASPLIPLVGPISTGEVVFGYDEVTTRDSIAIVPLRIRRGNDAILHRFYLRPSEAGWKLSSPLTAVTQDWNRIDTRFARVVYSDSTLINEFAVAELDSFIALTAERLQIFDEELRHLENLKLEYYLCNEAQIEEITGFAVHGMTSLPMDAVVSRHLPHYHEIVHALVNYRIRRVPLHTLPLVQEGLAVALGGRWEKSPDVLLQFGAFMLATGFVDLDSVLTNDDFQTGVGSLDISYAVGGVLSRYLLETYGIKKFVSLYERLSTPDTEVNGWDGDFVRGEFVRVYQLPWSAIRDGVNSYAARHREGRIRPGGQPPGGKALVSIGEDGTEVKVWDSGEEYVVSISAEDDSPELVIALRDKALRVNDGYESGLFRKHLPDVPYKRTRFGLNVTNAEAGLYDYFTDNLIEKYVHSFDPSDYYWNASSREIRFRLKKSALPKSLKEYSVSLHQP